MGAPQRRRILYLLPFAPRADATHGGGRVMAQLLAQMAERHDLALLYLRAPDEPPIDETLASRCVQTHEVPRVGIEAVWWKRWTRRLRLGAGFIRGMPMLAVDWHSAALAARLQELLEWQPQIIQIEYHMMGQYAHILNNYPAPRVLTEHEPGIAAANQRVNWKVLTTLLDAQAWHRYEPAILQKMHAIVVFTERDRQALLPFAQTTPLVQIPLGVPLPPEPLRAVGTPPTRLLFVGNFIHAPNVDAARRLVYTIFPRVRKVCSEAQLVIVGDQPPADLRVQAQKHVTITGRVPDVTPFLDAAALVVVPLRLGGGMRVKVLEALAAGKAVVASPLAVEGLNIATGEHVVLAESDEEFATAIVRLLGAPKERAALAGRARAWAVQNLDWSGPVIAYEALHTRLLAE